MFDVPGLRVGSEYITQSAHARGWEDFWLCDTFGLEVNILMR
jgi:hypothetical protein